ncbi:hypothetical protein GCM10022239_06620 [Leifsonia bigeumensis]|uniref:HPP family protein n=1 Tax=Leifsonella bigeumensis TaxID=433643 RepID=A0ABP7FAP6_9MICO
MPDPAPAGPDWTQSGWREPASLLPSRWGSYRGRYLGGLTLAFTGGLLIQLTSTYSLGVLPIGIFLHVAGWCILPGVGWRRVLASGASVLVMIILLNGAQATPFLAVTLAAWLLVRQRPLVSYLTLALPPVGGLLLAQMFPDYGWGAVVLPVAGALLAGAAWLGRSLAAMRGRNTATTR